jgi:hypothetical protein
MNAKNRTLSQNKASLTFQIEYGLAIYEKAHGTIEGHGEYMNDMQDRYGIAEFLEIAGGKGWELCAFLPRDGCLVFKRPC